MALQDLTPQLRTRLSRMERAVGWFVFLATALLLFGFGYYIYHTAARKGWFVIKAHFVTYVTSSSGLNVGDPVVMMGFPVGQITLIHAMPPFDPHNVKVEFEVRDTYFRYIWSQGSFVKVNAAGFLNQRQLEVTRGTNGPAMAVTDPISLLSLDEAARLLGTETNHWQLSQFVFDASSNVVFRPYQMLTPAVVQQLAQMNLPGNSIYAYNNNVHRKTVVAHWNEKLFRYESSRPDEAIELPAMESPAITEQLQAMVGQVQAALPGILALTNQLAAVLNNGANATANLDATLTAARPLVANFALISEQLREPGGVALWALGTNGNNNIQGTLTNVDAMLTHLADLTSNLNAQVQVNSNMLGGISKTVVDADDLVQGLKRHWLLRSAFKTKGTNAPSEVRVKSSGAAGFKK